LGLILCATNEALASCELLASDGFRDFRSITTHEAFSSQYRKFLCFSNKSTAERNSDFSALVPIGRLPIKLGFSNASSSSIDSSFCSDEVYSSVMQKSYMEQISQINLGALQIVSQCLARKGLHAWVERTGVPNQFVFEARFDPPGGIVTTPKVMQFVPTNADCPDLPANTEIRAEGVARLCTIQNTSEAASILRCERWMFAELQAHALRRLKHSPDHRRET
jgi:hypothetical protein